MFTHRLTRLLLVALPALAACADPASCDGMDPGHPLDMCIFDRASTLATPEQAKTNILQISDPVIRDAAIAAWMQHHPEVEPARVAPLCALLERPEMLACQRRASSPHLHRRDAG